MLDKINLPAVLLCLSKILLPFSSTVSYLQIISECKLILFASMACSISVIFIKYPFGLRNDKRKNANCYNENNASNSLYLRLEVKDKPGVLSEITKLLANNKISIERVIQIPDLKRKKASIVIITHKSLEFRSQNLIKSLKKNRNIVKKPILIRLF